MKENRIYLWDNLKFILIFLVLLGHMVDQFPDSGIFQSIYVFVYAFHMPLFFFISGMFHKNEAIVQKVCTFIALGYVYKFFLFAVRSILKEEDLKLHFFSETGTPWFMFALAVFVLITYLLRDMNQGFILVITLLMACFVGYDQTVGSKFVISRIIYFYPFYVIGRIANGDVLLQLARKKEMKMLGAVILVLWFLLCIAERETLYGWCDIFMGLKIESEELIQGQCLIRMWCYLITFVTGFACICITSVRRLPLITEYGRRTIQVYFWHRPILYILVDLGLVAQWCTPVWGRILYVLCALPVTFVLSLKLFSFPTTQILWFGKNPSAKAGKTSISSRIEPEQLQNRN